MKLNFIDNQVYAPIALLVVGSCAFLLSSFNPCYANSPTRPQVNVPMGELLKHTPDTNGNRPYSNGPSAAALLNQVNVNASEAEFIQQLSEAFDQVVGKWRTQVESPNETLISLVNKSKIANDEAKKKIAHQLVGIYNQDIEALFEGFDKLDAETQNITREYLKWLETKYEGLIKVLTKDGQRQQYTDKYILALIRKVWFADRFKLVDKETDPVVRFMMRMTPEQRLAFGKELTKFLSEHDQKGDEYAVAKAIGRGTLAYVNRWDAKGDWGKLKQLVGDTISHEKAYRDKFEERAGIAWKRHQAVRNYVKEADGKYFIDKKHENEFREAFKGVDPSKIVTMVTGLTKGDGHSNQYSGYMKQLAIAYSVTDGKRQQILPLKGMLATTSGEKIVDKGAIRLAQADEHGLIDANEVEKALKSWSELSLVSLTGRKIPRAHGYGYDKAVTNIQGLAPDKREELQIWSSNEHGKVNSGSIARSSSGDLTDSQLVSFASPPKYKPLPGSVVVANNGVDPRHSETPDLAGTRELARRSGSRAQNKLTPAGTKGNPGYQFNMNGDTCAANNVHFDGKYYYAVTAAHCVWDTWKRTRGGKTDGELNSYTAKTTMLTADCGKVNVEYDINRNYSPTGKTGPHDVAVLKYACPTGAKLPVTPPSLKPPETGEVVYYGKVKDGGGLWVGKANNFFQTNVYKHPLMTQVSRFERQLFSNWGDSGGGLYRRVGDQLVLIGIHSGWLKYATNTTLEFVMDVLKKKAGSSYSHIADNRSENEPIS